MERQLKRLAQQLDSLDEASLMDLWSKYATIASNFEPTKQWEDSVLVFALIQAKHWKNLLFNYNWMQQTKFAGNMSPNLASQMLVPDFALQKGKSGFMLDVEEEKSPLPKKECRVLQFVARETRECGVIEAKHGKTRVVSSSAEMSGNKGDNENGDTPE